MKTHESDVEAFSGFVGFSGTVVVVDIVVVTGITVVEFVSSFIVEELVAISLLELLSVLVLLIWESDLLPFVSGDAAAEEFDAEFDVEFDSPAATNVT